MAYNVLKGNVQFINSNTGSIESMVDDHSNQTIDGVKTFSQIITASLGLSASVLYTPDITSTSASFAELTISSSTTHTPLLILDKAEASSSFVEFRKEGVKYAEISTNEYETLYIKTDATSYPIFFRQAANTPLKFQSSMATFQSYPVHVSQSLHVTGSSFINNLSASNEISASAFFGSGQGLANIPASGLNLGDSTDNSSGNLIVKLSSSGGLESTVNGLRTNPSLTIEKTSPANADKFLLSDSAAGSVPKYLTYQNLAAGVTSGITTYPPAGNNGDVQIKNGSAFQGLSQLSFDTAVNTLTVTGQLTASVHVSSSQVYAGEFYGNGSGLLQLQKIAFLTQSSNFSVSEQNNIIGINTSGSSHITASLKAASVYESGAKLVFKDIAGSASINNIVIEPSGSQTIDGSNTGIKIQSSYGAVTIASNGTDSFFILGVN